MGRILRIGVPIALQDGLIQIAFLFITVIANRRGLTDAAAVGIVEKIISFLFLVPSSMLSTVSRSARRTSARQAPPRAADAVVCHRRRVRLRRAHLGRHPVRRRTGRRTLHA